MDDNPYQAPLFVDQGEIVATSITQDEVRAFVRRNANYYLNKWCWSLDGAASGTGFNWAAFLLSGFWIVYRKMYAVMLISFSIIAVPTIAVEVADLADFADKDTALVLNGLGNTVGIVFAIICGIFGNGWYLAHAKRQIARVRVGLKDEAYFKALARRGGTNIFAAIVFVALYLVLVYALIIVIVMLFDLA